MTAPSSLPAFGRTTGQTFEGSRSVPGPAALSTESELGAAAILEPPEEGLPALTLLARAALFIVGEGLSVGLFLWALFSGPSTTPYSVDNRLPIDERRVLVGVMLGLAGLGLCAGLFASLRKGQRGRVRTLQVAARLSPLMLLGFLPFLLRWQLWQTRELTLAVLAGVYGLGAYAAFFTAFRAPPLFSASFADYTRRTTARVLARLRPFLPVTLVVLGVLGYAAFFSYYTLQNHRNLLTASFDLGLENNLMWNVVNGGPFMKSSPLGPGSHFGYHATLFAYLIAPFYYFAQRPETLLVFQSAMIGAAALPLYAFTKRHIGRWGAAIVAFLYLFYPPVHGANLYDFHYLPLGVFFLWLVLYLVEAGRFKLAALAVMVTLSIREDVAASLIVVGAYLVLAGTRPRAGVIVAAVSAAYFVLMKMIIMPRFHGGESFLHQWQGLAPEGAKSYGGVLMTVLANPVFTLTSLLEPEKYLYIAQIAAPLCFFPWRRPIGYFLSFPGFFFTLLSTKYLPLVQISFQYTAHWSAFLFIAVVANLAYLRKATFRGDSTGTFRYRASLAAIALATLVCSYQYGALLQQNTARGGFGPYKFTSTEADRKRFSDLQSLIAKVPPMAKIVSAENIVPHVSSRPDSYTLRVGNFDADYMLFSTPVWGEELTNVNKALNGDFGVLAIQGDFVLAKRGHPKDQNAKALRRSR